MDTFDVPEIRSMQASPEDHGSTPLSMFTDMVLTSLISHAPALVHAEFSGGDQSQPVTWFVRSLKAGLEEPGLPIAVSDSCSHFRAALARFGHRYMSNQLYNGYSLISLRQRGLIFRSYIYMSNGGLPGFWIKIYTAPT